MKSTVSLSIIAAGIFVLFGSARVQAQTTTLIKPVLMASQSNVVFTDIGGGNVQITFDGVFDFSAIGGGPEAYSATFSYDTSVPPFATPPDPNVGIAFYELHVVNFSIFGSAVTPTFVSVLIQDGAGIFDDFFSVTVLLSGSGLPIPNTSRGLMAIGLNAGAFPGTMFSSTAFPVNLDIFASATGAPTQFAVVSLTVDGTVTPATGGTVMDQVFGASAQVTFPAGILTAVTQVAIDVFESPLLVATPTGFVGPGTRFVDITLIPQPSFPLPAPGLTVVLPLMNAMIPGDRIDLFRVDPATIENNSRATLVPALDVAGQPVVGTVDSGGLSATFNGVAHLSIAVGLVPVQAADLEIDKSEDPDNVLLGQNVTYTIEVENEGPGNATNVTIKDTLPRSLTSISAPGCGISGHTVTCIIPNLANHHDVTRTITAKTTVAGKISNTAKVTANEPDPDLSNNTDRADTAVVVGVLGVTSVSLRPSTIKGGNDVTGTVTLVAKAPSNIVVRLSSSNDSVAKPAVSSVTINKDQTSKTFTIKTFKVGSTKTVKIKASANGTSKEATLTVTH
jgi:uncharacterized repeat protein (TIGR01451 family)